MSAVLRLRPPYLVANRSG